MMDNPVLEAIVSRRTIRQFENREVADGVLDDLVAAGMAAPTAFDARPWHFVVIDDGAIMEQLARAMPGCEMCAQTAYGILVCADSSQEKLPGIWMQDCSACVQNIQLAAHGHGLGAVWLAIYLVEERMQAIRSQLAIPTAITPFALVPVGHPAEQGGNAERNLPERVHRNRW